MEMGAKGTQKLIRREKKQASASEGKSVGAQQKTMPMVMKQPPEAVEAGALSSRSQALNQLDRTVALPDCGNNNFPTGDWSSPPPDLTLDDLKKIKPSNCAAGKQCCRAKPHYCGADLTNVMQLHYPDKGWQCTCATFDVARCADDCRQLENYDGLMWWYKCEPASDPAAGAESCTQVTTDRYFTPKVYGGSGNGECVGDTPYER
jgi:hypothetical protein